MRWLEHVARTGTEKSYKTRGYTKVDNEIYAYNNIQYNMAAKFTRLIHKTAPSGRELYHLQLSLQAASPETFGYTLVFVDKPQVKKAITRLTGHERQNKIKLDLK
jgi:hypothetical protein